MIFVIHVLLTLLNYSEIQNECPSYPLGSLLFEFYDHDPQLGYYIYDLTGVRQNRHTIGQEY